MISPGEEGAGSSQCLQEFSGWGPRGIREERDEDRGHFPVEVEIPRMKTGMECPSQRGPQPPGDGTGKKGVRAGDLA